MYYNTYPRLGFQNVEVHAKFIKILQQHNLKSKAKNF